MGNCSSTNSSLMAAPTCENALNNILLGLEYETLLVWKAMPPQSSPTKRTTIGKVVNAFKSTPSWTVTWNTSVSADDRQVYEEDYTAPKYLNNNIKVISSIEIKSPPIPYHQLYVELQAFDKVLKENFTPYNNKTTSNHVHLSYVEDNDNIFKRYAAFIIFWWYYYEPAIIKMVDPRRLKNMYTKPLRQAVQEAKDPTLTNFFINPTDTPILQVLQFFEEKNHAITLYHMQENKLGTIEVRLKHGSSDMMGENYNWMRFLALFMIASVRQGFTPIAQPPPSSLWEFLTIATQHNTHEAKEVIEVVAYWTTKINPPSGGGKKTKSKSSRKK